MVQKKKEPSFEEGLDQLEKVVKKLEDGDLPLEKSLELFEQGVRLSDSCQKQLREAEHKVEILLNKNGKIETEPLHLDDSE
tara:strand:- start:217 stop:459 length:243 start_codon:yes stop_codon:yes gene_type:complete